MSPHAAQAGAWTMPQGQGQLIQTFSGWLGAGWASPGLSAPAENKIETQTYLEYGLSDRLTFVGQGSYERFALSNPTPDRYVGFDYSGAGLRARLWSNDAWVFSLEASAFVTGARDRNRPAQAGGAGLGPVAETRALLGGNLTLCGAPAFVDAELGYRLRRGGPPSEFHADLTLGIDLTARAQALAQLFNAVSNGAGGVGFPAWRGHVGQLSLVYALTENWDIQLGGFATLQRRNTNSEYGALVALWRRF
jgi:hypothetical protein